MTESERKEFGLLICRVVALEEKLVRFEQFWGWKEQDKPSDVDKNPPLVDITHFTIFLSCLTDKTRHWWTSEDIKAYIFDGTKGAK